MDPKLLLQSSFKEVQEAHSSIERAHESYIGSLVFVATIESQLEHEDTYIAELERKRNDAHASLVKYSLINVKPGNANVT